MGVTDQEMRSITEAAYQQQKSENRILREALERIARENKIHVVVKYKGSANRTQVIKAEPGCWALIARAALAAVDHVADASKTFERSCETCAHGDKGLRDHPCTSCKLATRFDNWTPATGEGE